ncbi:MAG: GIY-YIG nuclease family protein [Planctomycetota bacterium]
MIRQRRVRSLKDGSFYIGEAEDLEERLQRHNSGRSRYTSKKKPWEMVYVEEFATRKLARKREKEIKAKKNNEYVEYLLRQCPARKAGRKSL